MARRNRGKLPTELVRARERLAAWRRTKRPRSRIPETLWGLAVKLAGKHGLHRTAQSLKLDYYSLKKRVESAEDRPETSDCAFLELPTGLSPVPECLIELEDSSVSLRVQLKGYSAADIAVVGRSLRGTR